MRHCNDRYRPPHGSLVVTRTEFLDQGFSRGSGMGSFKRSVLATAIFSANLLSVAGISASAHAAQATDEQNSQGASTLSTVIVTGTRAQERTASASLSPIGVISGDSLRSSGSSELGTVLARLIPSINFPRPSLVDGAELTRPAQLRGLSPDQVLVLVNG
ncbi:TonB-dependent siderophore receptor, partial [Pseudomonas savastanoi pv. glycinea]